METLYSEVGLRSLHPDALLACSCGFTGGYGWLGFLAEGHLRQKHLCCALFVSILLRLFLVYILCIGMLCVSVYI